MSIKEFEKIPKQIITELGIKPSQFIREIIFIYTSFWDSEKLLKSIADDDRNFSLEILQELGSIASSYNIIYESQLENYQVFINRLEAIE